MSSAEPDLTRSSGCGVHSESVVSSIPLVSSYSLDQTGCSLHPMALDPGALPLTLLMKEAKRLLRHLICSFSSVFTLCTVGSISSSSGTSRLSLMVTGVIQAEGPQAAPTRYPKPGGPHLGATWGLLKPTLHRLREPRQPRFRRPPVPPGQHGPLLTA